jgi:glycerol-3-phosphate dehydrogenase
MGEDTVDALAPYFKGLKNVRTKNLRLHGVSSWRPGTELESHLYRRFGSDTSAVLSLIEQDPSLADPLIEGQPYVGAEFVYCARHEMATSLVDLLARRTRAHLHDARATLRAASSVASLVAPALGWNDEEQALQVNNYRMLVQRELSAAGLDL